MTVSTTDNKVQYNIDGETTEFSFSFVVYESSDVYCYLVDSSGNETAYTDFSIVLNTDNEGGTITTNTTITTSEAESILIIRDTQLTQGLDLIEGGEMPADSLENGFDKLTMIVQDQQSDLDRALKLEASSDQTVDIGVLSDGYVLGYGDDEIKSGTVLLSNVDSITARNTAIANAVKGLSGDVTLLQSFALAVNTPLSDVDMLATDNTVSSVHYLYYSGNGIGYYNSDGVTGEITSIDSIDTDSAVLTVDSVSVTLTACYNGEQLRENIDTNTSDIATNATAISTNQSEEEAGLSFTFDEGSTSAADAYVFESKSGNQTISAYHVGQVYRGTVASANTTTTPTVAVDGLSALTIVTSEGAAVVAGDIAASSVLEFRYDGTYAVLTFATSSEAEAGTANSILTPSVLSAGIASLFSGAIISSTLYTAAGTYTKSDNAKYVYVKIVGGGGGGGGSSSTKSVASSSGGQAGAGAEALFAADDLDSTVAITIGSAGSESSAGGTSTFGSYITVSGGAHGVYTSAGSTFNLSTPGYAAQTATVTGATTIMQKTRGECGGFGIVDTSTGYCVGGRGGNSIFGAGGRGQIASAGADGVAPNSIAYGAAGSGAVGYSTADFYTGGAGIKGACLVIEIG